MIILDLDNTLFNTSIFKEDIKKSFEDVLKKYIICNDVFWDTFYQAYDFNEREKYCYCIDNHCKILNKISDTEKDDVKSKLKSIMMRQGRNYLYPDVLPALEKLTLRKEKVILITHGSPGFQKLKLEAININHFFSDIFVVTDNKISTIRRIIEKSQLGEKILNINDHVEELNIVKKQFPGVECYIMLRKNKSGIGSLRRLKSLSDII